MRETAYDRAVAMFETLMDAPARAAHASPAQVIHAAGVPASSGYRHVATLEAEGLLRRDQTGHYLPGLSAIRVGLRGMGAGRFAPLAQPVLVQLRQVTQCTAFLGFARDFDLVVGPHSQGRETRSIRLQRSYVFEAIPDPTPGQVSEIALRCFENGIARRIAALTIPVESTSDTIALLGVVLNPGRAAPGLMTQALEQAFRQISGHASGAP